MNSTQAKPNNQFLPLGEAELKELKKSAVERHFSKGEAVWQEGDDADTIWIIATGRVNMVIDTLEGNSAIVHFCTDGQTFCPASTITKRPYPCSAIAASDATLLAVPASSFMSLFNRLPYFAKSLLLQMAPQVCDAHCNCALSTASVKSRLATLLYRLNRQFSGQDLPFTRQELADMSGTTVETAIRTLSEWEKGGVIHSQRGSIHVRKPQELEEAAGV